MKKRKASRQGETPQTEELCSERAKERLFETVRAIQQDNEGVDPAEVLANVTEAVEAVRQEEYERN